jgi:tetratricopeptide (TPR) repeat protein
VIAVLLVGAGGFLAYRHFRSTPPNPPDPKAETLEPAVVAAVGKARERVLKEPTSALAWGEFGEVLFANDLEDEARICFTEAGRLDRKSSRWAYLEGAVLVNRGDREGALPYLQRALELVGDRENENPGPRFVLAESLLLLGRGAEAEPHIRRILERKASDPRGHFDAGLLAIASGNWEGARGHLLKCLDNPATRQKARVQLAAVCRRLGDLTRAEEFQAEASRMPADADWSDPVIDACFLRAVKKRSAFRMAENLEAQGRFTEALQIAVPLAEEYPDDDVAQLLVGRLFAQVGEFAQAERALRRARQIAPRKVQPHYLLSLQLIQHGQQLKLIQQGQKLKADGNTGGADALFREAAALAREALSIKPDYGFAHMALGLALKELGQKAEARSALEDAVRCSPEYAEMHLRLAEVLDELDRAPEARERYQQALLLAPPNAPWRGRVEARVEELKKGQKPPGK